ncbi:MAG: tetratricopeptide repeat protein [Patescibacteria group bacterium]
MLSNILDRVSFWSLFLVIVLLPVFFLPFIKIPIEVSKGLLLVSGLAISLISYAAARFSDGKIVLPKSYSLVSGFVVVIVFLVSATFSNVKDVAFFGSMLDVGTFWFMLSAIMLMFMSAIVFKDKEKAKKLVCGLAISLGLVFLLQILRFFMPDTLSFGLLGSKTDNVLGSWNSLGVVAGFSTIFALFVMEFFNLSKIKKYLLGGLVLVSILLTAAVNFDLVWQMVGVFALIIFVYKISSSNNNEENKRNDFPVIPFVVILLSLLFFISGRFVGTLLPDKLGVSYIELNPSVTSTFNVGKKVLAENPVIGVGPNSFEQVWAKYKPLSVNQTNFWDTSFSFGSGTIPTLGISTGILGILALLLLFGVFIVNGVKFFWKNLKNQEAFEVMVFFIASLFLILISFFYSVSMVPFLLMFALMGVFIGLSSTMKDNGTLYTDFLNDPRKSFFFILSLVLVMIATAGVSFKYMERFASVSYFAKAIGSKEVAQAERYINKAIMLNPNDLYFRTYSQVYLSKMAELIAKGDLSSEQKTELQAYFDEAIKGANSAIQYNPYNHVNYQTLGNIYTAVAREGVEGAYTNAIEAYKKAVELNPRNPGLKLAIASAYLSLNNLAEARIAAIESLELKADVVDTLVTLAQIERLDGKNSQAIMYAEQAVFLSPNNKELLNFLNTLKGNNTPVVTEKETTKSEEQETKKTN